MVEKREVSPWTWQDNFGYSQAIEIKGAERTLICAGQTSVDAEGNVLHANDMQAQVNQALDNVEAVLAKAGLKLGDVVRMNLYTTDVDALLQSYGEAAGRLGPAGCKPAMTLIGVSQLAFPGLMLEIEVTAVA